MIKLDHSALEHCRTAVDETFHCLFGTHPKLKAVSGNTIPDAYPEISGIMPFVQDKSVEAALKVTFKVNSICGLMSDFYGEPIADVNRQVIGGIGEITNIVFGMLKEKFNSAGSSYGMSLPEVVVGGDHNLFSKLTGKNLLLNFECPQGSFTVELLTLRNPTR